MQSLFGKVTGVKMPEQIETGAIPYDNTKTYAVGDFVSKDGKMYAMIILYATESMYTSSSSLYILLGSYDA